MYEAVVAADRPLERVESERLLRALGQLCDEIRHGTREEEPRVDPRVGPWRPAAMSGTEGEQLVVGLTAALGRLVSAARSRRGEAVEEIAMVRRRLDGAEFVMRRQILIAGGERLPQLVPSLVFLILLPLLGHAEALRACERIACLLGTAGRIPQRRAMPAP
jgi:hypothetical protein